MVDVVNLEKRCSLKISRTHKDLVKRLFEREGPRNFRRHRRNQGDFKRSRLPYQNGRLEQNPDVDPIGACIGPKGSRISAVVAELKGEKIDIVKYSEDDAEFITQALSPATVVGVEILPGDERVCRVTVPDNQLSLQSAQGTKRQTGR